MYVMGKKWDDMGDFERVRAVVLLAQNAPPYRRPRYDYLVAFIEALWDARQKDKSDNEVADKLHFGVGIYAAIMTAIAIAGWLT